MNVTFAAIADRLIARCEHRGPDFVIGGHERPYLLRWWLIARNAVRWTLFITGPRVREWGFYCMERGFVHWKRFTAADDAGAIGKGCDA